MDNSNNSQPQHPQHDPPSQTLPTPITSNRRNRPQPLEPSWYRDSDWAALPDDCRVKCDRCHGHGTPLYFEMLTCVSCLYGEMACPTHACHTCHGSGRVCPRCRGMRFVLSNHLHQTNGAHDPVRDVLRCPDCCEGNNINPESERRAVERYMLRYRTWQTESAARGESYLIEPQRLRSMQDDAETRQRQAEFAEQQKTARKERFQRKRRQLLTADEIEQLRASPLPLNAPGFTGFTSVRASLPQQLRIATERQRPTDGVGATARETTGESGEDDEG